MLPLAISVLVVLYLSTFSTIVSSCTEAMERPVMALRKDLPRKRNISEFLHYIEPNIALINRTGIITLRLDCWAPYPIDMQFAGYLTNQETKVKTFRKDYHVGNKRQSCFTINATMESYEQITGNYTCMSIENPSIVSSFYIFVSTNPPGVLLARGQEITLQVKPNDTTIIFPCAISHPAVHVHLLLDHEQVLPLSSNLTYDPTIGFTMKIDSRYMEFPETYSCQTDMSPSDRVSITVLPLKKFAVEPTNHVLRPKMNSRVQVKCMAVDDFYIVTNPPTIPLIKNEVLPIQQNSSDTTFYRYSGVFESKELPDKTSGYIKCIWKGSNKKFAEWSFAVQNSSKPTKPGHLDKETLGRECPNKTEIVFYECSNFIECKINSCVRKDRNCHSNSDCEDDKSCMHSGLIQCPSKGTSRIFFTGFPQPSASNRTISNRYLDRKYASEDELLLLKEVLQPYPMQPDKAVFSCQGSNFVFSSGFEWHLIHENGAKLALSTIQVANESITVNNSWKDRKSTLESKLILPLSSFQDEKITHIECSAPFWDSWNWTSRRIPLQRRNSANVILPYQQVWRFMALILVPMLTSSMYSESI